MKDTRNTPVGHQPAATDAASRTTAVQPTGDPCPACPLSCGTDGHEDRPAVAVLVYIGQGEHLGDGLCRECATCTDSDCDTLGVVMDADYNEPWCRRDADAFGPEEQVSGPDIVPVGSERHRTLEQPTRSGDT